MNESTAQKYYSQHYDLTNENAWQKWQPKLSFLEKKNLSEFQDSFWQEDIQENVLATLAEFAPFQSVLDIGCSTGDFLIPLSRVSTYTYGVDIIEFSIAWELMKREYQIYCQQLNLDDNDLPFADASFDVVTMLAVLEHVFDVHHAIKEIARVLKPNGVTVIQVPNIAYIKHRLDLLSGRLPCTSNVEKRDNSTEWDGQHLHYFTLGTLSKLLNQYGLQVQKVRCSGKFAKLRWLVPDILAGDLTVFASKSAS
ncbi:class I SAM-dependent methyltransferase [Calothrix sp. PCC 7507]|uniref:class I SAM-dependent methyltransferase n=1 Tax=Calothrix sp. PCC 7507 TaxID=99598 RepID=UPI00029ED529|nr:class I SAM-dependent methyltransferase [Calothrix sp. PCC 7507]AFY34228.1 Methyltransferase type 11 [Calothrix sp. PCC 7507]